MKPAKRVRRACPYCGRIYVRTPQAIAENPFCRHCLPERLERAAKGTITMNPCPVYDHQTAETLPGTASQALIKAFEENPRASALQAVYVPETGLWEPSTRQGSKSVYIER